MSNLGSLVKLSELLAREVRLEECSAVLQGILAEGDTSKIIRQVESELVSNPDDLLLRALWVKNSLKLESIPLSVFVGPISSLLSEDKSGSKSVELFIVQSTLGYIDRLLGKKQFALVHDVTEALSQRVTKSEIGLDILFNEELKQLLSSSAKGELPVASVSPQSTTQSVQGVPSVSSGAATDIDSVPIDIPSSGIAAQPVPSTAIDTAEELRAVVAQKAGFSQIFQRVKTPIVLTLAAAIMVVGLRALFDNYLQEDARTPYVIPVTKLGSAAPMVSPVILAGLELGPDHAKRLDSVNQRVKGLEIAKVEEPVPSNEVSTTTTTQPGLNKSEVADLEPIGSPDKAPPAVAKKLPDVSGTKPVEVSNLDVNDRSPRIKDLRVGRDGRLYGPSADADPYKQSGGEALKTLDGKPVQSYEVQNFPAPRRFKTLGITRVLSAPSMLSTEVARLQPDAKIVVLSAMGPWLELRSKNGTRGYIYAQDAVPEEE